MIYTSSLPGMPDDLRNLIKGSRIIENKTGCSNSVVLHVHSSHKGKSAYLKVMSYNEVENLEKEVAILEWLKGKIPVPDVLYYKKQNGKEYLLMSEIAGLDCADRSHREAPQDMIEIFAQGLKRIHDINIEHCPFKQDLYEKLEMAKYNVENGLVDEDDFDSERIGKSANEIYDIVLEKNQIMRN